MILEEVPSPIAGDLGKKTLREDAYRGLYRIC